MTGAELPDETRLWLREQLARFDQLQADRDRKLQEYEMAPRFFRLEAWKVALTGMAAGAGLFAAGGAFFKLLT